jgi:lipoate-protein ligase A
MQCFVLPHLVADGPEQMGLDHALLDHVDERPEAAYLRTYEWREPTLSLGYFQSYRDAAADPRWKDVPIVRRPSGGGALWHEHDLTYALVLPRVHPATTRASELYRAVHDALGGVLRAARVAATRRGSTGPRPRVLHRPFLCFTDADPEDIVVGTRKLVGSAQRRRPAAVLQHGSLLLAGSKRIAGLAGLGDVAEVRLSATDWSQRICTALPEVLGLHPCAAEPAAAVRARAGVLARELYGNPAWTHRR